MRITCLACQTLCTHTIITTTTGWAMAGCTARITMVLGIYYRQPASCHSRSNTGRHHRLIPTNPISSGGDPEWRPGIRCTIPIGGFGTMRTWRITGYGGPARSLYTGVGLFIADPCTRYFTTHIPFVGLPGR